MQSTDGHQVKPTAIHLAAGLQQQLSILMIVNGIDQWRHTLNQLIKAHSPMPECQFFYLHCGKFIKILPNEAWCRVSF